jgi:tryptophan synthase
LETGIVSERLDFPGLGPELSSWKESGLVKFVAVENPDAVGAMSLLCEMEGIFPSFESSRAMAAGLMLAAKLGTDKDLVVCIGG